MATRPEVDFADSELDDDEMQPEIVEVAPVGYRIIIEVGADGQIAVGTEDMEVADVELPDGDDLPVGMAQMSSLRPVNSIREAMEEALSIYRAQGDETGLAAADEAFDSGFGGDAENKRNGLEYR